MKTWVITTSSAVSVALAFMAIGAADLPLVWELIALFAAFALLNLLYIPRYPKAYAFRQVLSNLKPGQKIEVEGK